MLDADCCCRWLRLSLAAPAAGCCRRRLLLHRQQITKLFEQSHIKGNTLVALRLYWKGHLVKVEIGVGAGKDKADQRASLKTRAEQREMDREVSRFNRGKRG